MNGYKPRYKALIKKIHGCQCLIVDDIIVPFCDCFRHKRREVND